HLALSPASATISSGGSQAYTAQGRDQYNNSLGDMTSTTTFTLAPDGSCAAAVCSATSAGAHTVTGTAIGASGTATLQVNPGGHSGSWAAVLTHTGTSATTFATLQDAPNWVTTTTAGTYTGSIWVRADTAGAVFKLKLQEYSGSTLVGSNTVQATLTTSWQQVTVTYTIKSAGSTLDLQGFVANPGPGKVFYADDA